MSGTKQEGWGKEKFAYGAKMKNIEDLTFDQIRLVGELKPKVVVCENVKGLTHDYAREYLIKMVSEFEKQGYVTDFKVLNAWQYGVPQKRERVFIVSIRQDIADKLGINILNFKSYVYPLPSDEDKPLIEGAIRDIQDDPKNIAEAKELCDSMKKGAKYKWLKRLEKNPENVASVGDNVVKPWYLKLIAHRERMIERVKGYSKPVPEAKFSFFQSRRVPWHQASHTLSEQGLKTSLAVHLHPSEDRVYTTYEAARLMTLPEDYIQTGELNDRLARIGLMVAPMCMKHLADSIYENVLEPYARN
jgi:DNA-cytosine methyltransferase